MANKYATIYDMIKGEENAFQFPITVMDGWDWSMKDHIKTSLFYKHGRLLTGNLDTKPVKNIVRPILNLAYRAEDIDVKDIEIYVNDSDKYHLSFLVKKYHDEVFIKENDLDTFFDEFKEEKIDFGGAMCKKVKGARPEKIPMQSIAFCDQTDLLASPFGLKHNYSPDQLKEMESNGWGDTTKGATLSIDDLIILSTNYKTPDSLLGKKNQIPGNTIEVYEVRGTMPIEWLLDNTDEPDENKYIKQIQIVAFYKDKDNNRIGCTLFKSEDKENTIKLFLRDQIYGRALGFGGVEELFENQVWTNYSQIRKKEMLDAAAKTILKTTDPALRAKHPSGLKNVDNLELLDLEKGTDVSQVDTFPRNAVLFDRFADEWEQNAKQTGSATGALLGETNGAQKQSYNAIALITSQGQAIHTYRKGKFAKFIEEIYQDWIIPYIVQQITKGTTFLAQLSRDEMEYVADCVVRSKANEFILNRILNGQDVTDVEVEQEKETIKKEFFRGGSKKFLQLFANEIKGAELKVKINVAGKENDLAGAAGKLTDIFKQIFANPAVLDDPRMAKILNKIIEYSGLDPFDFSTLSYKPQNQPVQSPIPSPIQQQNTPVQLQANNSQL